MIRWRGRYAHFAVVDDQTIVHFGDVANRLPVEIVVMSDPVVDVVAEHFEGPLGEALCSDGPDHMQRVWCCRTGPSHCGAVLEVGDMVAVEMRMKDCVEGQRSAHDR